MYLSCDRAKHHQFFNSDIRGYFGQIPLSSNYDQMGQFRWGLKHGSTRGHARLSTNASDSMFVQSSPVQICFVQSSPEMEFILAIFGATLDNPAFLFHCIHIDMVRRMGFLWLNVSVHLRTF